MMGNGKPAIKISKRKKQTWMDLKGDRGENKIFSIPFYLRDKKIRRYHEILITFSPSVCAISGN